MKAARHHLRNRRLLVAGTLGALVPLAVCLPATAQPSGQVDSVQTRDGTVQVLFSLHDKPAGTAPDLSSVQVTVDGEPQAARAELASDSEESPERSTVLAIDVSDSMKGDRFAAARRAALTFTDQAPDDVRIGLVSFAGAVNEVQPPTNDRDAVRHAVNSLQLQHGAVPRH